MSSNSHHSSTGGASAPQTSSTTRLQNSQDEKTANARKAFLSSLSVASRDVDFDLQTRAKALHSNAEILAKQEKQLQDETKQLAKDNQEWENWLAKSQQKLAELDDILNFDSDHSNDFEADLGDIEAMLDIVDQKQSPGKGAADSSSAPEADTHH